MGFRIPHVTAFHRAYRAARTPLNGHRLAPFLPAASLAEEHQNHSRVGKRWHVGHSHDHHHHHAGKGPEAEGIFRLGLAADVALATGKAFTGYISGSTAIVADAAHSVSDIVLSGVSWWSFRAAKAPKDQEHPYGRRRRNPLEWRPMRSPPEIYKIKSHSEPVGVTPVAPFDDQVSFSQ